MPIDNLSRSTRLAVEVEVADTSYKRMRGLLGRSSLDKGHALIITACNSIHMLFMKFPIDVVFIDRDNKVVGLSEAIKPYAFSPIFWKASCAIELPVGTIRSTQTARGDQLRIV